MSIRANLAIGVLSIGFMAFAAAAQTAKEIKGATPLVAIPNEAPARLVVDPPVSEQLALGRFGHAALSVSPRVGHLHYYVDGQSWPIVDTSGENGRPRRIEAGSAHRQAGAGGRDAQTDLGGQPGRRVLDSAEVGASCRSTLISIDSRSSLHSSWLRA